MDAQHWDEMYSSREQVFSGNPNGVLVAEVTDLPPGRALDVGCGEGADAAWLARRGWQVTAVDISEVALRRAAATAPDVDGRVAWTQGDLTTSPPPAGAFDLVSSHYFPLMRAPGHAALHGLLAAVAPGGTLLFVTHALADFAAHEHEDFDPADYYQPDEVAQFLDAGWDVVVNETRPRTAPPPPGTHHMNDTVLRARRRPVS